MAARTYFFIVSEMNNQVMDTHSSTRSAVFAAPKSLDGSDSQLWYTYGYAIRNKANDFCLDLKGNNLIVDSQNSADTNQRWQFNGTFIQNVDKPSHVLACHHDDNSCQIYQELKQPGKNNQQWVLEEGTGGGPVPGKPMLDYAFVMDTTGSMMNHIRTAKQNIRRMIYEQAANDIKVALVGYKDHGDSSVTRKLNFTSVFSDIENWLEDVSVGGGGDAPEAVADGLFVALNQSWRPSATKVCVLIADAPPHGLQPGDHGCPSGHDTMTIGSQLLGKAVTLHVIGCGPMLDTYRDYYTRLANMTGGQYVTLPYAYTLPKPM